VNLDEKALKEKLLETRTNNSRIASFVSENSYIPAKKVQTMMRSGTTLSAQEALKLKIVHQILHKEIPPDADRVEIIYVN
jgi:ATP-dependent protease ClpP protease subunit